MVEATRVELQDFNPLPRKEGDLNAYAPRDFTVLDFNPLPRKEGD